MGGGSGRWPQNPGAPSLSCSFSLHCLPLRRRKMGHIQQGPLSPTWPCCCLIEAGPPPPDRSDKSSLSRSGLHGAQRVMEELRGVSGKRHRNDRKVQEAQCPAVWIFTRFIEAASTVYLQLRTCCSLCQELCSPPPISLPGETTALPSFLQDAIPHSIFPIPTSPLSQHPNVASLILTLTRL